MFDVDYDRRANVLTIIVKGFWVPDDVSGFAAAVAVKAQDASRASPQFDVLVESLDFPVQAMDVADMLVSVMSGGMALTAGRAAVVVGSHLNKAQAERTLVHPRVRVFMTLEDARGWLAEEAVRQENKASRGG